MSEETQPEPENKLVAYQAPPPSVTPAQAKVDAIASLTMSAYQKASTLQLTPEEIAGLTADFPDDAFQTGADGKEQLIYIQHAHLRDRLNSVFGPGQWAIVPRNRWAEDYEFTNSKNQTIQASRVYVEAMLCVRGCFVAEAIGDMVYYKNNASQNYGDAVEGAKTAALRRCAKELGIGLQAWKKEWTEGWWARRRGGRRGPAPAPPAPPATPPKVATEDSRARFIAEMAKRFDEETIHQWAIQYCGLPIEQWPLQKLPLTKGDFNRMVVDCEKFAAPYKASAKPKSTPQSELESKILGAGFTFDQFRTWADKTGNLEDSSKYASFGDLPQKKALHWLTNHVAILKAMSAAYGHEEVPTEAQDEPDHHREAPDSF